MDDLQSPETRTASGTRSQTGGMWAGVEVVVFALCLFVFGMRQLYTVNFPPFSP